LAAKIAATAISVAHGECARRHDFEARGMIEFRDLLSDVAENGRAEDAS
jgi:hypothetical protein